MQEESVGETTEGLGFVAVLVEGDEVSSNNVTKQDEEDEVSSNSAP